MLAVIKTGGKQYVVREGDVLHVEKRPEAAGQAVLFDQVLLIDDGAATEIGSPVLEKALVKGEVLKVFKDEKILVFKKKRRKQFRRTRGHRQTLTEVRIVKIYPDRSVVPAEELAATAPAEAPKPAAAPVPKTAPKPAPKPKPAKKEALRAKPLPAKAVKAKPVKTGAAPKPKLRTGRGGK